jgi:hypothetical protein
VALGESDLIDRPGVPFFLDSLSGTIARSFDRVFRFLSAPAKIRGLLSSESHALPRFNPLPIGIDMAMKLSSTLLSFSLLSFVFEARRRFFSPGFFAAGNREAYRPPTFMRRRGSRT